MIPGSFPSPGKLKNAKKNTLANQHTPIKPTRGAQYLLQGILKGEVSLYR